MKIKNFFLKYINPEGFTVNGIKTATNVRTIRLKVHDDRIKVKITDKNRKY